ncbi:MAG: hypothetical protein ACO3V0_02430 [Ilumatobacteraceae bacterium]|jgi:SMC interacting uncharacterized protein involved in chromosome segregation|nr:hypothetical protein [Ilumatobacteraceae bacterium]MDA0202773.1 hypothetical protein [Actinomycetota bacterium]MDA3010715.1 hypothetical protein [Actinomycetota bacterium]
MAKFTKRSAKDLEKMAGFRKRTTKDLEWITSTMKSLEQRVGRLDAERSELADRLQEIADRAEAIDVRLTTVSTEIARQIDELGNEVSRDDSAGVDSDAVAEIFTELRDGQTRLANEQARYQIAFRQDLANLVEQLRRS